MSVAGGVWALSLDLSLCSDPRSAEEYGWLVE